jgi:hypothetical protein
MAFKPVADLDTDKMTAIGGIDKKSGKKNPTSLTGYFIGTKEVESKKSKTGKAAVHVFQTKEGNVGVWGKTNLDVKMRAVTPGVLTRVSFTGMVETKNNPMYKYNVEVDSSDTIEVGGPAQETLDNTAAEHSFDKYQAEEDLDADDAIDSDLDSDDAPLDEVQATRAARPARAAATPDAASQARVQQLLNSRRART